MMQNVMPTCATRMYLSKTSEEKTIPRQVSNSMLQKDTCDTEEEKTILTQEDTARADAAKEIDH